MVIPDFCALCAVCADAQACANDDKNHNSLIISNSIFFAQTAQKSRITILTKSITFIINSKNTVNYG